MKNLIMIVVIAVVVGIGAFFSGIKYQQGKQPTFGRNFTGQPGQRNGVNANRKGLRPVNGDIISNDGNSITVKLQDGSSKIVIVPDSAQINKADVATKADLTVGEKVAVFGTDNTDGSVTAQNIQLNPSLRGQFEGNQPTATGQAQ